MIVDLVGNCVRSLSSDIPAEREIAVYVLNGLLAYGSREDRIPSVIVRALVASRPANADGLGLGRLELLRRCALRNLEFSLTDEFAFVVAIMSGGGWAKPNVVLDQVASVLAAGSRIDSRPIDARLRDYLSDSGHDDESRKTALYRIGAAALDAGATDVAVTCAVGLSGAAIAPAKPDWLDFESARTESGSYLGNSPRDALAQFADFFDGLAPQL